MAIPFLRSERLRMDRACGGFLPHEAAWGGFFAAWILFSFLLVSAVSAAKAAASKSAETSEAALVWPDAPAQARIQWLGKIREPADLGIHPGFFYRMFRWIVGNEPVNFVRPHGVTLDSQGRLWVTDPGARCVHIFDPVRKKYQRLPLKGERSVVSPVGIAADRQGIVYVSDSADAVIRRFDAKGHPLSDWKADGQLVRPTGLGFDENRGLLWVVDTGRHEILALDEHGKVLRRFGGRGTAPGRFNFPTHLSVGPKGRLFVVDTLNFRVQILSPEGSPIATIGELGDGPGTFSKPKGIALDRDGHVYVVDGLFDNVQVFDQQGSLLLFFGDHGAGRGDFWLPAGIAMGPDDRIYVVDAYNRRLQIFKYLGE